MAAGAIEVTTTLTNLELAVTTQLEGSIAVEEAGGGQPMSLMQPYLVVSYQICWDGDFPPRN
jgi:microcystin-dependent protein